MKKANSQELFECVLDQKVIDYGLNQLSTDGLSSAQKHFFAYKTCLFFNEDTVLVNKLNDFLLVSQFKNGRALAKTLEGFVVVNENYEELFQIQAPFATLVERDFIKISDFDHKTGLIDLNNNIILPMKYDDVDVTLSGFITLSMDSVQLLNQEKKINKSFSAIKSFKVHNQRWIELINEKDNSCVVNEIGNELVDYRAYPSPFAKNKKSVFLDQNNKVILINQNNQKLFEFDAVSANRSSSDLILVKRKDSVYLLNTVSYKLFSLNNFTVIDVYSNRALLSQDNKYGVMDSSGSIVIQPEYDIINGIDTRFTLLNKGEEFYSFDWKNKNLKKLKNESLAFINFSENSFITIVDGKYGVSDFYDNEIIKAEYDTIYTKPKELLLVKTN